MSDDEIVKMYADKDEKAIVATKGKYHNYLYKISFQILGNHEDAEECLDDVFLEAWNAASNIYEGCLQAFLVKLTKRISIDRLRSRNRQKRKPIKGDEATVEIVEKYTPDGELILPKGTPMTDENAIIVPKEKWEETGLTDPAKYEAIPGGMKEIVKIKKWNIETDYGYETYYSVIG